MTDLYDRGATEYRAQPVCQGKYTHTHTQGDFGQVLSKDFYNGWREPPVWGGLGRADHENPPPSLPPTPAVPHRPRDGWLAGWLGRGTRDITSCNLHQITKVIYRIHLPRLSRGPLYVYQYVQMFVLMCVSMEGKWKRLVGAKLRHSKLEALKANWPGAKAPRWNNLTSTCYVLSVSVQLQKLNRPVHQCQSCIHLLTFLVTSAHSWR